jgi:hypothetical protein
VAEKDKQPDEPEVADETAVPLPERDAMSLITGPLVPVDGGISQDPTPPSPDRQPPPDYRT